MTFEHFKGNNELQMIAQKIQEAGGKAFLVGGCVRDAIFGVQSKDIDVEVFNIQKEPLLAILKLFGKVDNVGESFEVIKLTTETQDFDFSFPRREMKVGLGHKGFQTEADPFMEPKEAAKRRDFTINALMLDIATLEIFDFFGGLEDLRKRVLKHTSEAFAEDPLRVLRAMQFASRFNMDLHPETIELCKKLKSEFSTISKERIWTEFEKMFSKGVLPSKGIKVLFETKWADCFEAIHETFVDKSDPIFELDIAFHLHKSVVVGIATLCCDSDEFEKFLEQINAPNEIVRKVTELIKCLNILDANENEIDIEKFIKITVGLNKKFCSLQEIGSFILHPATMFFNESEMKPKITGEDLKLFGWDPKIHKKAFGEELKRLFEIQLRGNLSKEELVKLINKI